MQYSLSILIFTFYVSTSLQTYSQKSGLDYISAAELNQHLSYIFEDKGLLDELITLDHNGDSAVFVLMNIYPHFAQFKPYENDGYKTYFWNTEDIFFHNINPPIFKIHSYEKGQLQDIVEFVSHKKKSYRIRITLKHYHYPNLKERLVPAEIESIQIAKIKWKDL